MRYLKSLFVLFFLNILWLKASDNPEDVIAITKKVADWQIQHFQEVKHKPLTWTNGPFYLGLVRLNEISHDEDHIKFIIDVGNSNHWQLNERENKYHADDFCVAQMYLEMYKRYGTKEIISPTLSKADFTITNPSTAPLWLGVEKGQERWSWCDALFMAPPVYAGLYDITGKEQYLEFLDREFKVCVDSLYDHSAHLFYRDRNYKSRKEQNSEKVFWGRGNGWAFGGIASVMRYLPKNHRAYWYFADIFREMASGIIKCQDKNGYWHPSMLDPESFPDQENSATGLLTYGLAWGLNNGLLDESVYKDPVMKAWGSMVKSVSLEGKLGYVQKVGQRPEKIYKDSTEIYGAGAFLLAGTEIFKLLVNEKSRGEALIMQAKKNGLMANEALSRSRNYLSAWLEHTDPVTGLIPRYVNDKNYLFWNAQDCAADNYVFMVLTSFMTDRVLFNGKMKDMLETEKRLTSRLGACPATYSFIKQDFLEDQIDTSNVIFGSAEYMKDGLVPLTEWLGQSPWSFRMIEILNDFHKLTTVTTKITGQYGGGVPEIEVNGDMLQTLSRVYWMTGNKEYLDWAIEIADYYLLTNKHPNRSNKFRLRDHGCEILQGLCELYATLHYVDPGKKEQYKKPLYAFLDRILKIGRNNDGFFYNEVNPRKGSVIDEHLADTWGYSMNGYYIVYLLDNKTEYLDAVMKLLDNLDKYKSYKWEGENADGYADAIESALNLNNRLNRSDVSDWIDSEISVMWSMQHIDGIIQGNNADGNFARTSIMHALWKTQGTTVSPWNANLFYGAVKNGNGITLNIETGIDWDGLLIFDKKRHRKNLNLPFDWPRINQFPEWFTTETGLNYSLKINGNTRLYKGEELQNGIYLRLKKGDCLRIDVVEL